MHLLNTSTLKLKCFTKDVPAYAILSHTWDDEEVAFEDIGKPHATRMAGYQKILGSCSQALKDGFEWIWVDTCCIDKRSSAELSEAINSMYKWYWEAEICYAYLADVPGILLIGSTWFRRGWTLQELLAPAVVDFYSYDWKRIGSKSSLANDIWRATGIEKEFILDRRRIKSASVGKKFSWTSQRETTRLEDMAYSLLGIVDVNMPLLYGEGSRAFYRLQLEIMKQTPDHTIFAWEPVLYELDDDHPEILSRATTQQLSVPTQPFWDMLAPRPRWFSIHRATNIQPWTALGPDKSRPHEMTNVGLRITLPCIQSHDGKILAILGCRSSKTYLAVQLRKLQDGRYAREFKQRLLYVDKAAMDDAEIVDLFVETQTTAIASEASYQYLLNVDNLEIWDFQGTGLNHISIGPSVSGPEIGPPKRLAIPIVHDRVKNSISLKNNDCGAVILHINGTVVAIVFGDHHHHTYLRLLNLEDGPDYFQIADIHAQDILDAENTGDVYLFRDYLEEQLNSMTFEVSARRARRETMRSWELTIRVWKTSIGKPGRRLNTNRKYFKI